VAYPLQGDRARLGLITHPAAWRGDRNTGV
jgi:hypothetical protein